MQKDIVVKKQTVAMVTMDIQVCIRILRFESQNLGYTDLFMILSQILEFLCVNLNGL